MLQAHRKRLPLHIEQAFLILYCVTEQHGAGLASPNCILLPPSFSGWEAQAAGVLDQSVLRDFLERPAAPNS
jgi:hypothetical protein